MASDKDMPDLTRRLRRSAQDLPQILRIVQQAEQSLKGDLKALCQIYGVAQQAFGPFPQQLEVSPEDYGELSVKRLQALRQVDPEEAKVFYRFLAKYNIRQQDHRVLRVGIELGISSSGAASAIPTTAATAVNRPQAQVQPKPQPQRQGKVVEPPAATAKAGSRNSSTPIRPRSLRYSGCSEDTGGLTGFLDGRPDAPLTQLQQELAETSALGSEDLDAYLLDDGTANLEFTMVSGLDGLSPILECESPKEAALHEFVEQRAAEVHRGALQRGQVAAQANANHGIERLREPVQTGVETLDTSGNSGEAGKAAKTFEVNGVPYTKVKTIGRGGTSKVYQVLSPSGETLALKRVVASCSVHFEALANEVTLLRHLKDCPNIIQVLDAEVLPEEQVIHIVMECGDLDLGRLLQVDEELGLGDLQALWREMLDAVQVIHDEKIVHSDLKPGNFLRVGSRLKLIDFGIAKKIASHTNHITRENSVGTISYMAPETVQAVHNSGFKIGRPSDVWSLGIILYQMVYMRCPFSHLEPLQRVLALTDPNVKVEFPSEHCLHNISETTQAHLRDVLERCLQRDPRKRPTIPELLAHPFLAGDCIRMDRNAFEALVRGFFIAANATVWKGVDANLEAQWEGWENWQTVADQAWQTLDRKRGRVVHEDFEEGMEPFRQCVNRWMVESGAKPKRPRLGSGVQGVAAKEFGERGVVERATSSAPAVASFRGEQAPLLAPETAPPLAVQSAPVRKPLALVNAHPRATPICSEMLQKQLSSLRKASAGKENVAPLAGLSSHGAKPENMVLRRLKDRRALIIEEREEFTQMTGWGVASSG